MGNRGKGTKGKTNKKGKRGKGKSRAGGASKWGDEDAARADEDQPRKKKPRLTQVRRSLGSVLGFGCLVLRMRTSASNINGSWERLALAVV